MTKLSSQQLDDLCRLATDRVGEAFNTVDQLVEDPQQQYILLMAVTASLVASAADYLHETTKVGGKTPSPEACLAKVIASIIAAHGLNVTVKQVKEDRS